MMECMDDDPCCNGLFCCEKKFWPKRCQEEEPQCPKSDNVLCTLKACDEVNDPCCNGPFCCEKKFWPKRCQEEEKGQMEGKVGAQLPRQREGNALPKPCFVFPLC